MHVPGTVHQNKIWGLFNIKVHDIVMFNSACLPVDNLSQAVSLLLSSWRFPSDGVCVLSSVHLNTLLSQFC